MKKVKWFIVCITLITFLGFADQGQKIIALGLEKEALMQEEKQIAKEVDALKTEIALLEDPSYIEILARENLGMIYPNETLFVKTQNDAARASSH